MPPDMVDRAQASEPGLPVRTPDSSACGEFCGLATLLLLTPLLSLLFPADQHVPIPPLCDLFSSLETWELSVRYSGEQVRLVLLGNICYPGPVILVVMVA